MEYCQILNEACDIDDEVRRMAYVAVWAAVMTTACERSGSNKPFNPILGETYEYVTDQFDFLSEQVSHHPPITANYAKGKNSDWVFWNNQKVNTKFSGKGMEFV